MSSDRDLVVVGGGLMGLAIAVEARGAGLSVAVLEAEAPLRHASSASAGGVRSLNRNPAEIALARAALPLWAGLAARLGAECGFRASGQVRVAEDDAAMAALEARAARTANAGYRHERIIGAADLFGRIPSIARHCRGALVVDDDGFADPLATGRAYLAAAARSGVELRPGHRVVGLARMNGALHVAARHGSREVALTARHVVNAAGAWGGTLAALAGDPAPVRAAGLQMAVTAPLPHFVTPVVGSEGRKLSLKQTKAGAVVIGGGFEGVVGDLPAGQLARILPANLSQNLANAVRLFPQLSEARLVRSWAGIEGMLPDGLPILGPSPAMPGLVHAFGFSAHGFALVPLIGQIVGQMVTKGRFSSDLNLAPFAIERFSRRIEAIQGMDAA